MRDQIIAYLADRETEAVELLRRLVEIQSGSRNKPGLDLMAESMSEVLGQVLPDVRILPFADYGNMVQASSMPWISGESGFALVGHMDTVFPANTSFTAFQEDGEICRGPGVYDMKGGLVVGVYALKALQALGALDAMPVTFLCNSDEEIGSPASRPWIEEQAGQCLACLVFEGGGLNREVVTGRKGRLGLRVTVRGRAGHAAKGGSKASAILELAHKITALEALNKDAEITLNVGHVEGGIGPNTVPELAQALVDARFLSPDGQSRLRESLAALFAEQTVPGTSCEHVETTGRPAMPQSEANKRLYAAARRQAARLGYGLPDELRFGVSDANFIADRGVPVLDGLGPLGDLDHSDREYIVRCSLMERSALVASLLLDLWSNRVR
ncbi:M20 family metallopeptidase [Desulfonatronum thiodismutans]|uniref:M20 family metallopeptidase n=1 Tax=Desulfonatronum thiodismutans TaxID=159290 RepID=UPI0005598663|nr:M20 family metallopeptidase [Desulfonatronum thiodismutans]